MGTLKSDVLIFPSWHQSVSSDDFQTEMPYAFCLSGLLKCHKHFVYISGLLKCRKHFVYRACWNVINILFIGLPIFETKQWFLTLKSIWRPTLFLIHSRLTAVWGWSSNFSKSCPKKETAFFFFFLFLVLVQCIDKTFFGSFLLPSQAKYNVNSPIFAPF